jgi:hypothetical protein
MTGNLRIANHGQAATSLKQQLAILVHSHLASTHLSRDTHLLCTLQC